MMRAVVIAAALLSLLAPPTPALAQFGQMIDPLIELFQPKPKPKPRQRPPEPVPLPPMNPLHQPAEPAPPPETPEEAEGEPPVPLPPILPVQQGQAPAKPPPETDDGAAAAGEPPSEAPVEDEWSPTEIMEALRACIARLGPIVAEVEPLSPIKAQRCGTAAPVRLKRLGADPGVEISPAATLNCDVVLALDTWIKTAVQPAAERLLGTKVVRLRNATSYSCRNRNNAAEGPLSEHAFANALDVSRFITEDGRRVDPRKHWGPTERDIEAARKAAEAARKAAAEAARQAAAESGKEAQASTSADGAGAAGTEENAPPQPEPVPIPALRPQVPSAGTPDTGEARATIGSETPSTAVPDLTPEGEFLHAVHKAACGIFGTVLGPEANDAHKDHFHLDMKPRRRSAFCE